MSTEIIEEGNIKIAKFMELDKCTDPDHESNPCYVVPHAKGYHKARDLQYHSSWDWLMPVVEKINKIKGYDAIIYKTTCHINNEREIIIETTDNDLIKCVWLAVIEFIKWYQNQILSNTINHG